MTNEEKANELGKKYETPCHGVGDCEFEAKQAALEAMEWKDEQAAAAYCKCCDTRECEDYESSTCYCLEKFKKVLRGVRK